MTILREFNLSCSLNYPSSLRHWKTGNEKDASLKKTVLLKFNLAKNDAMKKH
jgi:hypothetical protein